MSRYSDEYEIPFSDDYTWEDCDRDYDEMIDEQVLAMVLRQRLAEMTRKCQQLERENAALRKMLHDTDTIRDSARWGR